jgi:predicted glycogen debranching enzyme
MGMLPNRFQDGTDAPEYNNADATLWFFVAAHKSLQATNDKKFILKTILPVLGDIIAWHHQGTRYRIHVDADGLLFAGEPGTQLTWMDAKVGDWVVTPRIGKAVEVNALWYNAQCIYADLLNRNGQQDEWLLVKKNIDLTHTSFRQQFWNNDNGYLYDVIDGNAKDVAVRPNALFAISLPYALFDGEKALQIIGW